MKTKRLTVLLTALAAALSSAFGQTPGTTRWTSGVLSDNGGGFVDGSPAIASDGTIYITSTNGFLYSINPSTGGQNWSLDLGNVFGLLTSSPVIGTNGIVYVHSMDGNLYMVDPSNPTSPTTVSVSSGENVSTPALGSDGTIYLTADDDDRLFAVNPDGTIPSGWPVDLGDEMESSPVVGPDCTIYVITGSGNLVAVNADGTQKWTFSLGLPEDSLPTGENCDYRFPIMVGGDGTIYTAFGPNGTNLIAINPNDPSNPGNPVQKWIFPGTGQPGIGAILTSPALGPDGTTNEPNGTLYFADTDGKLYAVNTTDGSLKWKFFTWFSIGELHSSPAVALDGTIYFGSGIGNLYAVNPDGSWKWQWVRSETLEVVSSPAIAADGTIIFGSNDQKVHAVYGSSPLANSAWPMYRRNLTHVASQSTGNCGVTCDLPYIIREPVSQKACSGSTVRFQALAGGSGTLTYQWKKNGTAISGATTDELILPGISGSDAASAPGYTVTVANSCGAVDSTAATLTVASGSVPMILQQPVSVFAHGGSTVTFHIVASGFTGYQWKKNGANISGATTDTLSLSGVSIYDMGSCEPYTCVVSSGCSTSVTSASVNFSIIDLFNVQFCSTNATTKTGAAAIPEGASDFWNVMAIAPVSDDGVPDGTPSGEVRLYDNYHNLSSIYVDIYKVSGDWPQGADNTPWALDPLLNSFVFPPAGGTYNVWVRNLTNGVPYDIYLYGEGGTLTHRYGSTFQLIYGGSTALSPTNQSASSTTYWDINTYGEGNQYVVFRGVVPTSGGVIFQVSGLADVINGIQIRRTHRVTGLTAAPSGSTVVLNWNAVSGESGGYVVRRGTSPGSYDTTVATGVTGTTYTDTTAGLNTVYYYQVALAGVCPEEPTESNEASAQLTCTGSMTVQIDNQSTVTITMWLYHSDTDISYSFDGWNVKPILDGADVFADAVTISPGDSASFTFDAQIGKQYNIYGYGDWIYVQSEFDVFNPTLNYHEFHVFNDNSDGLPDDDSGDPLCTLP